MQDSLHAGTSHDANSIPRAVANAVQALPLHVAVHLDGVGPAMTCTRNEDGFQGAFARNGAHELLVTTAESSDARIDGAMQDLLRLIRRELQMDVAFLAEFVDGRRVFRQVDASPGVNNLAPGDSHTLEESLCQRLVDGRIPRVIGDLDTVRANQTLPASSASLAAHMGVPVRMRDGTVYGTLCCFSFSKHSGLGDVQLRRLEMSADLARQLLEQAEGRGPAG